jgi:hypothetical protein
MTRITTSPAGIMARISSWIRRHQRDLSDRIHAADDQSARRHGWEVTTSTGVFGFGTRTYRDPRFNDRRQRNPSAAAQVTTPQVGGYQNKASNDDPACGVRECDMAVPEAADRAEPTTSVIAQLLASGMRDEP